MRTWTVLGLGSLMTAGLALAGCQSTADRSATARPFSGPASTARVQPVGQDSNASFASRGGNNTFAPPGSNSPSLANQAMGGSMMPSSPSTPSRSVQNTSMPTSFGAPLGTPPVPPPPPAPITGAPLTQGTQPVGLPTGPDAFPNSTNLIPPQPVRVNETSFGPSPVPRTTQYPPAPSPVPAPVVMEQVNPPYPSSPPPPNFGSSIVPPPPAGFSIPPAPMPGSSLPPLPSGGLGVPPAPLPSPSYPPPPPLPNGGLDLTPPPAPIQPRP